MQLLFIEILIQRFGFNVLLNPNFLSKLPLLIILYENVDVVVVFNIHLHIVKQVPVTHALVIDVIQRRYRCFSLHQLRQIVVLHVSQRSYQIFVSAAAEVVEV